MLQQSCLPSSNQTNSTVENDAYLPGQQSITRYPIKRLQSGAYYWSAQPVARGHIKLATLRYFDRRNTSNMDTHYSTNSFCKNVLKSQYTSLRCEFTFCKITTTIILYCALCTGKSIHIIIRICIQISRHPHAYQILPRFTEPHKRLGTPGLLYTPLDVRTKNPALCHTLHTYLFRVVLTTNTDSFPNSTYGLVWTTETRRVLRGVGGIYMYVYT